MTFREDFEFNGYKFNSKHKNIAFYEESYLECLQIIKKTWLIIMLNQENIMLLEIAILQNHTSHRASRTYKYVMS